MILEANSNNVNIHLLWIRGHGDIFGNEKADELAKRALTCPQSIDQKINVNNFLPLIKKKIFNSWEQEWDRQTTTKGIWYKNIQHIFPRQQSFKKFPFVNRRHLTSIIRMRTGHCSSPQHLFRLRAKDDPFCECGQLGNLEHIIFTCPINEYPAEDIYWKFFKPGLSIPLNCATLLANLNHKSLKILIELLEHNQINL